MADTVDGLAADVLTLGSESRSTEKDASPTNIHALSMQAAQMMKDSAQMMKEAREEVTASKLEIDRFQETARLEMVDIERRALYIERQAQDQEILRMQIIDGRMDSLPDEERVRKWAHVATKGCLEDELATAISSITATSASYAKN